MQAKAWLLGRKVSTIPLPECLQTHLCQAPGQLGCQSCSRPLQGWDEAGGDMHSSRCCTQGRACRGAWREGERRGGGERNGGERKISFTCSRRKSWGLKSFGEHPHQSTMCLYWHLQPSLRFQLVTRRLLSTSVSQARLFSRTVWKKDCARQRRDRTPSGDGGRVVNGDLPTPHLQRNRTDLNI